MLAGVERGIPFKKNGDWREVSYVTMGHGAQLGQVTMYSLTSFEHSIYVAPNTLKG